MNDNKTLDLLGIKGLSDSVRIATKGLIEGAGAFLSRVCLPAAEEFGLMLRDQVSAWRAGNAVRMLSKANSIYHSNRPSPTDRVSPRLAHVAVEEASWIDDDQVQEMWSGLLASSTSPDGCSDENLLFMNLLKQLSSLEVSILRFAVEKASKDVTPHGLILSGPLTGIPVDELPKLFGVKDLQRIDRELDHLRELGLIGWSGGIEGGGISAHTGMTNLTPSSLALHLYVRAQGSKLSPADYWNLSSPADENTARKQARTASKVPETTKEDQR